jgi:hypothetical protein
MYDVISARNKIQMLSRLKLVRRFVKGQKGRDTKVCVPIQPSTLVPSNGRAPSKKPLRRAPLVITLRRQHHRLGDGLLAAEIVSDGSAGEAEGFGGPEGR